MNLESGFSVRKEKKEEDEIWPRLVAIYAAILRDETWLPPEGLSQREHHNFKPTDLVSLNSKEHNGMTFVQNHTGHTIADAGRQTLQKISNSRASENYRPSYNLNLSSRSEAGESSSAARLFKLGPVTPDQHKQLKINQINQVPRCLLDTISTQDRARQDNEDLSSQPETVARERTSSAGFSTAATEKQNSDGGQGGIDLNETPPQKTPKRKKHQPKVVVEGIPKRTPESTANKNNIPDGNPPPKSKYACKRGLDFDVDNGAEKKSKGREFDSANKVQHQESSWPLAATKTGEDKKEMHSVDDTTGHKKDLHIDANGVGIVGEECNAVVPYKKIAPIKKPRTQSKVNLDPETSRLWNLLMSKEGSQRADEMDEDEQKYWDKERQVFRGRVDSFIARMHHVQGDRKFSEWKGSVVDSVIGVFLTQNVSDQLSSSAFMSLAAKFPLSRNNFRKHHDPSKVFQQVEINAPFEQYQFPEMGSSLPDNRKRKAEKEKTKFNWDSLRRQAQSKPELRGRNRDTMDSIDYEALLHADVREVSEAIKERGMNIILAERIKDFLNRLVRDHERVDLEWLRDVNQDKARDYLLSIQGLGPKSVDCVRLLTLHHLAFPVDTNVGRIAVRLGWVPLQPLPGSTQFHLVDEYPMLATVQKYLWPRLCKLDQETLYELHYQMITFGKVFCTKKEPNCDACPMRRECRHFKSASASKRLALPIIEEPKTPESPVEVPERDIEDAFYEDPDEIAAIRLNVDKIAMNFLSIQEETEMQGVDMSKALVPLSPEVASIPGHKLKHASRLRSEHLVYELPDSHPLLKGLDKREADDPSPYLFALWTPDETADSVQPLESKCSSSGDGLCSKKTFESCNSITKAHAQTVRGTILIPCRTAMRGSFPLNGTYFQVNEVFADHETSLNPVHVQRGLIWNLPRRTVFFGTSVSTILKGMSAEHIRFCFWKGFVCVRGFEPKSRAPRPLHERFHRPASKVAKDNE